MIIGDEDNQNINEDVETNVEDEQEENKVNQERHSQQEIQQQESEYDASEAIQGSLVQLGFVNFDSGGIDNATTGAMVSAERRQHFRRDIYVGIRDTEQNMEFLGRIVEGPFHSPHEVSLDSAITRITVLHPERTQFRPEYYVHGNIEVLGELSDEETGEKVLPTPTRPRPYSEIYIFPANRLRRLLGIEGDFQLGQLMGYQEIDVFADVSSKNFLPRNVGIFGTVGSGKSNTTQVLMEEAINAGWAVIVIDVEGEYVRMNEPIQDQVMIRLLNNFGLEPSGINDFQVYVPSSGHSDAVSPTRFKVPISELEIESS